MQDVISRRAEPWSGKAVSVFLFWMAFFFPATYFPLWAVDSTHLYKVLQKNKLNPYAVYDVRGQEIVLPHARISLERGTIAFTEAVDGRVTGAMFEGEGEVLVSPPNDRALRQAERESLALFTGSALLDERFTTVYFRFSDDSPFAWRGSRQPLEGQQSFLDHWGPAVQELSPVGALPIFTAILNGSTRAPWGPAYFIARFSGGKNGTFTLRLNSESTEQFTLSQVGVTNGVAFENVWMRFPIAAPQGEPVRITDYRIQADVTPPTMLSANAEFTLNVDREGVRAVVLRLSHHLKVDQTGFDGQPLETIQEESDPGSIYSRGGDDVVTLVFPKPLPIGVPLQVRMKYAGPVLSDAGNGLLYVGARGTWYPNRGPELANFDLRFSCPPEWTLAATGEPQSDAPVGSSHWRSRIPVPMAGFNLGQYSMASAELPNVTIQTFATRGIEKLAEDQDGKSRALSIPGIHADPARNVQQMATRTKESVADLQQMLGPFPFGGLRVTQQPGDFGQGWPGLIYLSSLAFVGPGEIPISHTDPYATALYGGLMLSHETAHQWFGDYLIEESDRDTWLIEALANYSALLTLERSSPGETHAVLEHYRESLLQRNGQGVDAAELRQAGAVSLGYRLTSSRFPQGYVSVTYGRGTWLLHMLRMMMRDPSSPDPDAAFQSALQALIADPSRTISNRTVLRAMEQKLPRSLQYEDRADLDWFYEGWINGTSIPTLRLKNIALPSRRSTAKLATANLWQSDAPKWLVTPVPLYAEVDGVDAPVFLGWVFADGEETPLRIRVPSGTRSLLLDAEDMILRRR